MNKDAIYHNRESIDKIEALLLEKRNKICLFIGRQIHEELPNEPGVIWVSLDNVPLKSEATSPERIHLILDCNQSEQLAIIQGLFSKVVIDQSTWKFFQPGIIERLTSLLIPDSSSSLIFESSFQFMKICDNLDHWKFDHIHISYPLQDELNYVKQCENCYLHFIQEKGGEDKLKETEEYQKFLLEVIKNYGENFVNASSTEELIGDFQQWLPVYKKIVHPTEAYIPLARQQTLTHLQKLFNQVELNLNTPYPYPTNYRTEKDNFFCATAPIMSAKRRL